MAQIIVGHGVSRCFGTRLAPKTGLLKHLKLETSCGDGVLYFFVSIRQKTSGDLRW